MTNKYVIILQNQFNKELFVFENMEKCLNYIFNYGINYDGDDYENEYPQYFFEPNKNKYEKFIKDNIDISLDDNEFFFNKEWSLLKRKLL